MGLTMRAAADGVRSPAAASDLEVRTDVPPDEWDAYVAARPEATMYHRSAWAAVIRNAFGHASLPLAAVERGRVVGLLPVVFFDTPLFGRFAVSMPFLNYGGIVADSPEVGRALLAAAIAATRDARGAYLELRHTRRMFEELAVQTHKVSMLLPLERSVDAQWTGLDRKLRNQIRKAEKSNLTVRCGGVDLLDAFYDVLAENMRDLGSPVQSRRFYEEILKAFPDRSRLLTVWLDNRPVAASCVLWHGDRMEVPWASSLRRYNPLCPNVLLYWEMLKCAIGQGVVTFDFGRSTPLEGTYQFKAQWGAEAQPLYWEYWLAEGARLPDRSPTNRKFEAVIAVWQRLPVAVTRALGPRIVRDIP